MKIALWGCGNMFMKEIDVINLKLHEIKYVIDSDIDKCGKVLNGAYVSHYSKVEWKECEAVIITICNYQDVRGLLENEIQKAGMINMLIFNSIKEFLAYEYVNITNREINQNPLYQILKRNNFSYNTDKRLHFLDIYHKYFEKYRNTECVFLEIGVFKGDSIKMWKEYLGKSAKIIGVDIDRELIKFSDEQVTIEIGSQDSRFFWKYIKEKYKKIDVILDDGGHTMNQQITTFLEMFPHISSGGVYICEDTWTSYWYGGGGGIDYNDGLCREKSFIEFALALVDEMERNISIRSPLGGHYSSKYTRVLESVSFYPGICAFVKNDYAITSRIDNRWCGK